MWCLRRRREEKDQSYLNLEIRWRVYSDVNGWEREVMESMPFRIDTSRYPTARG